MKKIYIITEGSYSDYHIVGVAEDRETAQILMEKWDLEDGEIEEYTINTRDDAKYIQNKTLYTVTMWKNGNTEVMKPYSQDGDNYRDPVFRFWGGLYTGVEVIVDIEVWADSPEHAVKIANEKRSEWIATGRWDEEVKKLETEQKEYYDQEKGRYNSRQVLNEDGSCSHISILASTPKYNEAFYWKGNELYKIYRCQFCYGIVNEEKVAR